MSGKETERIYALARCSDGRWLLLNRKYKPFGVGASPRSSFNYDECNGIRAWLCERGLRKLDGGSRPYRAGDRMLWLFHDGTNPRLGGAHLRAYERRLAVLDFEEQVA